MKVGTDAVLLGSWTGASSPNRILDVGTGCGLIALMMAQRYTTAHIDAIDIDEPSIVESSLNFSVSPWGERLHAKLSSLQEWQSKPYDLIVSNPPYFSRGYTISKKNRALARSQESLSFESLLTHTTRLLHPAGKFALVLPASSLAEFFLKLEQSQLNCQKKTEVLSFEGKSAALVLLELGFEPRLMQEDQLCIRTEEGNYHSDYLSLTRDFYLFS